MSINNFEDFSVRIILQTIILRHYYLCHFIIFSGVVLVIVLVIRRLIQVHSSKFLKYITTTFTLQLYLISQTHYTRLTRGLQ